MIVLIYLFFVLLMCYTLVLFWLALGYLRTSYAVRDNTPSQVALTLIICARNEEKTISFCLNTLLKQTYDPKNIQLLLINDASSDRTVQKAESILGSSEIDYRIISNPQQKGKKQSITYAMQFAKHELIVLRDADTFTRSPQWLQSISDFYLKNPADLIIAPVAVADNTGLFWALQAIENNVLAVMACGSSFYKKAFLCNGANLIFKKSVFAKTNGYASHLHIPSGDDIFFLEDVKKNKGSVAYLKSRDAIVHTYPSFSLKDLILQKTRWASKFKSNKNTLNLLLACLSFAVNLGWLFCFVCMYLTPFKHLCLLFIFLKLLIDILLLFLASGFIKNKTILWLSLPVGLIYPVYATVIGLTSVFMKTRWK